MQRNVYPLRPIRDFVLQFMKRPVQNENLQQFVRIFLVRQQARVSDRFAIGFKENRRHLLFPQAGKSEQVTEFISSSVSMTYKPSLSSITKGPQHCCHVFHGRILCPPCRQWTPSFSFKITNHVIILVTKDLSQVI